MYLPFGFHGLLYRCMSEKQDFFDYMGGRVRMYRGRYNPTCDAVWLAAFVPQKYKTALDVGVGTGGVSLCMKRHYPNGSITGIDVSDAMLAECALNASANNIQISLLNQDIFHIASKYH